MKKLRTLFIIMSLFVVGMCIGSDNIAEASNTLNNMSQSTYTDENGCEWYEIQFDLDKNKLDMNVGPKPYFARKLIVHLQNAEAGNLMSDYSLDGKFARFLSVRKSGKKDLDIVVTFAKSTEEQEYEVLVLPKDKKLKKKDRLVIRIALNLANLVPAQKDIDTVPNVKGKTIVIDPGHGGSDSGAQGPNGVLEKDANLTASMNVKDILEASGAKVVMTRTTDVDVFGPDASDVDELQARVDVADNAKNPDIFVSIHSNAFSDSSANGSGTYYHGKTWRDELLAQKVQDRMIYADGLRDRGISHCNFYVCRNTSIPACLVEMAFITNYREEQLLADNDFLYNIALGICQGISDYFAEI